MASKTYTSNSNITYIQSIQLYYLNVKIETPYYNKYDINYNVMKMLKLLYGFTCPYD
jgi:hypothetical protein